MAGAARRMVVASTRTTAEEMAARWCVVTSEGRSENVPVMRNYLLSIAAANHDYAQRHSYLFRYAQLSENRCPHPRLGRRAASWCKILAVADVLLNGIDGQRCHSILYLDSDAVLSNASLSIDGWLERARERRDEALLLDNDWRVLLSSNYWFDPDEANTGVFLLRASGQAGREACGILRRWWDGRWSTFNMNRPWEQVPMAKMLSFVHPSAPDASAATVADGALSGAKTPWGTRVRLMPTARFYRRRDPQWQPPHPGSWAAIASGTTYSEDDFIHHGIRSLAALEKQLAADGARHGTRPKSAERSKGETVIMGSFEIARAPQFKYNLTALTSIFNGSSALDAVCPKAVPTAGTPDGFDTERGCCRHARRINRSAMPCWEVARGSPWVSKMASWTCV